MQFAARVQGFAPNPFTALTLLAQQHNAVNLGQGFPDWSPEPFVLEAAAQAFSGSGHHQYVPPRGVTRLLEGVARLLEPQIGVIDALDEVTITAGATQALHVAMQSILNAGDEVILLEPKFDSYAPQVKLCDGVPVFVQLELQDGAWTLPLESLRNAITPKTRAILLNTPHNPTGKVFSRSELEGIAALALEFGLWVISDEVYDRIAFDAPHISIASLPGMRERTITIGSAGKIFSVTGWRIGWVVAPKTLTAALRNAHQWMPFCIAAPLQEAVATCLEQAAENGYYVALRARFLEQRDFLVSSLERAGFQTLRPEGGYFVIADVGAFSVDADAFAQDLVTRVGVAAMPIPVFYDASTRQTAPNALRFAICKKLETLQLAASKLERVKDLMLTPG
jgi:aspartate/methionine/tyrosine aminotransferase